MKIIKNTTQKPNSKMKLSIVISFMLGLTACAGSSGSDSVPKSTAKKVVPANAFKVSFDWDPAMKKCFSEVSPQIQLINVPAGTNSLSVVMVDEDAPNYDHGGGKVNYTGGSVIPAGALKYWKGPCPPSQHKYTFKVTAYGGAKSRAKYSQKFPK